MFYICSGWLTGSSIIGTLIDRLNPVIQSAVRPFKLNYVWCTEAKDNQ